MPEITTEQPRDQDLRYLIEARGLSHSYARGTPLECESLHDIDFELYPGDLTALIGASGSGKSTLLQHLNGLLLPQKGTVRIMGRDLSDPGTDLREIRRTVGLVMQQPENQLFETYVADDVAYGPRMAGLRGAELRERVQRAMELVGLDFGEYGERTVFTLSGGERRKAGLAGIISLAPRILLLDEPTAGLDPKARQDLMDRLLAMHEEGMGMIIATHDMECAARMANRIYILESGRVVLSGTSRSVFTQIEMLKKMRLDAPAPVLLMTSLREAGLKIRQDALTLEEAEAAILKTFSFSRE